MRPYWTPMVLVAVIPLSCTVAFAALPISRRRAKVRWAHLVRAMLYSYAFVWIAAWLSLIAGVWDSRALDTITSLYWMAAPLLLISFWWCAARFYLRMSHGLAVAISVTVIGILLPTAVGGAIWVLTGK